MLCTSGSTCGSRASAVTYWWGWLALIMAATSLMLRETGNSSVITCILSSTSVAPVRQKRERGCFEWIDASVHKRRTSAAAAAAAAVRAERSLSSHRDRCEEQITELQLTCWANQGSQSYIWLTRGSRRIVRLSGVYRWPSVCACDGLWLCRFSWFMVPDELCWQQRYG